MSPDWKNHIESDPNILHGKPCFRNSRIPVSLILGYLATGATADTIVLQFPDLSPGDVSAALEYARDLADFDAVALS
jgi:uncharacterized protein (DUF433 family)